MFPNIIGILHAQLHLHLTLEFGDSDSFKVASSFYPFKMIIFKEGLRIRLASSFPLRFQ